MAADKTTTKKATPAKTAKKAAPKSDVTLAEQLASKRTDLLEARKSLNAGELVNPRVINGYRKDIARLLTAMNADKLKESK